jgi:hypothetical protein
MNLVSCFRYHTVSRVLNVIQCLFGKGQKVLKGLVQLGELGIHGIHPTVTTRNALLLLVGNFKLGNVLNNGSDETIGPPLGIFFKGRVDGIQSRSEITEIKFLDESGLDVGLLISCESTLHGSDRSLVSLDFDKSLLDGTRTENVRVDFRRGRVQDFRGSCSETTVLGSRGRLGCHC